MDFLDRSRWERSWKFRAERMRRKLGWGLQGLGRRILERKGASGVWLDVGAHLGESTLPIAQSNPSLMVYAFEPNWSLARQVMGKVANFVVVPMAVAEEDGVARFFVNGVDDSSSLLPLNPEGVKEWKGERTLRVERTITVPTIRLDTFLRSMEIERVEYLKIDTQGTDLAVVRSAGPRLKDIQKVKLEADVTRHRAYQGSASRSEMVAYLEEQGFALTDVESQSMGQEENLTFERKGLGGATGNLKFEISDFKVTAGGKLAER